MTPTSKNHHMHYHLKLARDITLQIKNLSEAFDALTFSPSSLSSLSSLITVGVLNKGLLGDG